MSSTVSGATSTPPASTPPSTAAVTSTGIGSGLDISAIVASLTSAFGAAQQNQLTNQANSLDAQVSAFGTFTSALDTLQGTLSPLENPSTLAGFDAAVGDTTIASATASSDAVAGNYSLAVQNLASAATLTSAPVASSGTTIGTGTLTIAVGGSSASISHRHDQQYPRRHCRRDQFGARTIPGSAQASLLHRTVPDWCWPGPRPAPRTR